MGTMHCYVCHCSLKGDTCPECGRIAVLYNRPGGTGYDMVTAEDLDAASDFFDGQGADQ